MKTSLLGTTTSYQQIGNGMPLVLLHGWGCDWQIWSPVITELSKHHQLLVPDLPVLGQSTLPKDSIWSSLDYVTWLQQLIEERIPGQPFILGGHSFGGKIAALFAAQQQSDLLKGLILIDAAGIPTQLTRREAVTQAIAQLIPQSIKNNLGNPLKKSVLRSLNIAADYQDASPLQQAVLRKIVREDITHYLAQIELPSLLIWGKKDTATPVEKGELFAELMTNATLMIFEESGHYPFVDQPADFIAAVIKYTASRH